MKGKIKVRLRRFLSIALAALILAGCAGAAFADGSDASGTLNGVNWVYTAADKTLVLSGSGTLDASSDAFSTSAWNAEYVKIGADVDIKSGLVFNHFNFVKAFEVDADSKYLCSPTACL